MADNTHTKIQVALAGNPNCGKTSIFNNMTGSRQHVGNYAGVTVEKKVGEAKIDGHDIEIIDLPGTYSLTARSLDELAARNVIINENPELIANVVDASNLERNLYLTAQLIELEQPLLLVLNMVDVAKEMGLQFNNKKLEELTGSTVVETIGRVNKGTEDALRGIVKVSKERKIPNVRVNYGEVLEPAIAELEAEVAKLDTGRYPHRWVAIKLLEQDTDILEKVQELDKSGAVVSKAEALRAELNKSVDMDIVFPEYRHRFAVDVFNNVLEVVPKHKDTKSDNIDKILTNRWLGLPIFLLIMWVMFYLVITLAETPQHWIEDGFKMLTDYLGANIEDELLKSLINDGIIGGVGAVISFIPNIVLLFVCISFLEDTGYMARAAFVIDRVMRGVGLHGKSFIPMLLGFGCNVPSIMGARILDNPRDRMITILVSPFMSCSARLPVYTLLAAAFFPPQYAPTILLGIYALGIIVAVVTAKVLRTYVFKGEAEPFVMEMPPYHMPTLRSVGIHMWERSVMYLKKAGTFILAASVLIWFLTSFPQDVEYSQDYDAAKAEVTAMHEQKADSILDEAQLANDEDKDKVSAIYDQMLALDEEHKDDPKDEEEATAEETTQDGAEATDEKEEVEEPAYFEELKADELYPVAWNLYVNHKAEEDEIKELDLQQGKEKIEQSYAAQIGHFIEPVTEPLGFNWRVNIAVVAAVAAKEVMISTLGTIYAIEASEDDSTSLQEFLTNDPDFTPSIGLGLMVFALLYLPCLATMAVLKRETDSWKWFGAVFAYTSTLAWVGAYIAVHLGRALGLG
ncbi:ferrous iron transport protein B [Veillonella sp. CNR 79/14]|uniref:ferrous iron transport protein B n=1 Tax=Veillonella sp. CNR 79/14 TaxID=2490954 RepID=UPI000F8D0C13|nr:ferrous iron transport protein B [Veillonella sp. CNR 79/14]